MSSKILVPPHQIISDYVRLLRQSPALPDIAAAPITESLPLHDIHRPCALVLSPHPDDECLTGALALRLRHENWQIINLAVTLGSRQERREERAAELAKACVTLGFDGFLPQTGGFENVIPDIRSADAPAWQWKVDRLSTIIAHYKPQAVFFPHVGDGHPTHIGTHFLGMDALQKQPRDFSCAVVQTEYWQPALDPNLMIGVDEEDVAQLLSALACHVGEIARNPYDMRFAPFLIDNVRRGSERVGGKGVAAAPIDFAMLYQFGIWKKGKLMRSALNRVLNTDELVGDLMQF